MRDSIVLMAALAVLTATRPVSADDAPPPPLVAISPAGQTLAQESLEQSGHRKKVAGVALIAVGSALNIAGLVVTLAGIVATIVHIHDGTGTANDFLRFDAVSVVSAALTAGGYLGIAGGVLCYVVGGRQMKRARVGASVSPVLSGGGGVTLSFGGAW